MKTRNYHERYYLGLRRAFIWTRKIQRVINGELFFFCYGDDIQSRFFLGTLKDCRKEKKNLLKMKTTLIGRLDLINDNYKISILGADRFYRKRFTQAHLLGWFILNKKKILENGGVLVVDDIYRGYFLKK